MKRIGSCVLALAFVLGTASLAAACDKDKATTGCGAKAALAAAKEGKAAGVGHIGCYKGAKESGEAVEVAYSRVMSAMPDMTYKIGDFETACCKSAKAKAAETGSPIVYQVGGESFPDRAGALNKLAELMTAEMPKLAQVHPAVDGEMMHCPTMAAKVAGEKNSQVKYMLAGVEFDSQDQAQSVADRLASKMKDLGCTGGEKVETASGKAGCGGKAAGSGCCAKKGETAAASGCGKKAAAETAAATGGCAGRKAAAAAAEAVAGAAQPESAKTETAVVAAETQEGEVEDPPAFAQARQTVRRIVEFVVSAQADKGDNPAQSS